jgi:N-acetyl-anhydromuramyl-L-alanine amidase AmpD
VSLRTRAIWGSLVGAMALVTGGLSLLGGHGPAAAHGRVLAPLAEIDSAAAMESVFDTRREVDASKWTAIVIHHSGSPADSPAEIDQRHRRAGLAGLGYHFVVGNGTRMADGAVHVGERWLEQQPGAHVAGPDGAYFNGCSIGICLVGDGDRRAPSDAQVNRVIQLVSDLARELDIPRDRIFLHRDLATTSSPGRLFPASLFYEQIAWLP